ncbi:MAG: citrate/2-methylcitrate synthase [Desulfomonilaceae bacterium]
MAQTVSVKNTGLRGVTVADTKVSFIDGNQGILIYRGYRIEELAEKSSFPEVAFLLLNGYLPTQHELKLFEQAIADESDVPEYIYECMRKFPVSGSPMDSLQACVPLLAMDDHDLKDDSREANLRRAIKLVAKLPVIVAAWNRISNGLDPLPYDSNLSHAGNFLWRMTGSKPDDQTAKDLDCCLVLHADHTFNASTFACREVCSTRAHMYAAVTAGIGALSGSLHGGANTKVMEMLLRLENEPDVSKWIKNQIDTGQKIMGLGHAVYKTMDPRAKYLKPMATRLAKARKMEKWDNLSKLVERVSVEEFDKRGKSEIRPNVDFYSAPVYFMLDIPKEFFTPIFAISRIAGWCSHIIEEKFGEAQEKPALYRPQAEYVGNYCGLMGCEYSPLSERPSPEN